MLVVVQGLSATAAVQNWDYFSGLRSQDGRKFREGSLVSSATASFTLRNTPRRDGEQGTNNTCAEFKSMGPMRDGDRSTSAAGSNPVM